MEIDLKKGSHRFWTIFFVWLSLVLIYLGWDHISWFFKYITQTWLHFLGYNIATALLISGSVSLDQETEGDDLEPLIMIGLIICPITLLFLIYIAIDELFIKKFNTWLDKEM